METRVLLCDSGGARTREDINAAERINVRAGLKQDSQFKYLHLKLIEISQLIISWLLACLSTWPPCRGG